MWVRLLTKSIFVLYWPHRRQHECQSRIGDGVGDTSATVALMALTSRSDSLSKWCYRCWRQCQYQDQKKLGDDGAGVILRTWDLRSLSVSCIKNRRLRQCLYHVVDTELDVVVSLTPILMTWMFVAVHVAVYRGSTSVIIMKKIQETLPVIVFV